MTLLEIALTLRHLHARRLVHRGVGARPGRWAWGGPNKWMDGRRTEEMRKDGNTGGGEREGVMYVVVCGGIKLTNTV